MPRGRDMWTAESDRDANPYLEGDPPLPSRPPAAAVLCRCCGAGTGGYLYCTTCESKTCFPSAPKCGRRATTEAA